MMRKEFCEKTRDRFAEKYHKQISYRNTAQILDCMRDVAIEALQTDKELNLRNIATLTIREPYIKHGYNSFKKEPQDMLIGMKVRAKIAQGFLDDVIGKEE